MAPKKVLEEKKSAAQFAMNNSNFKSDSNRDKSKDIFTEDDHYVIVNDKKSTFMQEPIHPAQALHMSQQQREQRTEKEKDQK